MSKFKVLLTIVVGITLTATSLQAAPVSAVAGFGDVATDDYYAQPVQWARNNQIINIEGACFSPNTEMTRGETAVHLWKMQDRPPAPPHSFVDITNQDHQEAVAWLTDANLTTGATDTTFDPDGFLTRAHIVTFLWRLKGEPAAPDRSFDDVTANWQQKSVGWALQEGITNGTSAKTFSPNQRLNRAQMLTFLWRYKGEPQVQFERESPVCEAYGTTSGTADAEPVSNEDCDFSDHARRVLNSVYQVRTRTGTGTAFYIGDNEWLTAEHVVEGTTSATLHNQGTSLRATVVGRDDAVDIALLSASSSEPPDPLSFGSSSGLTPGTNLTIVGFPLFVSEQPWVTRGVLSRFLDDSTQGQLIVTDAAVNSGNSGGPVLDECGSVVGLVVSKLESERIDNVGFALAESTVQSHLYDLRTGGTQQVSTPKTWAECFGGNDESSNWDSAYSDGPDGWLYETFQHKLDDRNGASAFLYAIDADLNDYGNVLPDGCEFTPYIWAACVTGTNVDDFRIGLSYSMLPTGVGDNSETVTVKYQLGTNGVVSDEWSATETFSIIDGDAAVLVSEHFQSEASLKIWGYDILDNLAVYGEFDLTGYNQALQHLQSGCDWGSANPRGNSRGNDSTPALSGPSDWTSFDGEGINGHYIGAYTRVDISEYSWQDNYLLS